jgi:6-pyruvoyltetrahydropterin/6-carboxytetrahydropterin synthase
MTTLTRRYRFSASHRLHVNSLSDPENQTLFGKCNNPFGHGHDYVLSVTVAGEPNEKTGLLVPVSTLDLLVEKHVLNLLAHRNLNIDVTALENVVPTTENVVSFAANILAREWPAWFGESDSKLIRIALQETERNSFRIELNARQSRAVGKSYQESVPVNV